MTDSIYLAHPQFVTASATRHRKLPAAGPSSRLSRGSGGVSSISKFAWQNLALHERGVWSQVRKAGRPKLSDHRKAAALTFVEIAYFPHAALARRLEALREAAEESGDELSSTSEILLHTFIEDALVTVMPKLTLRPGGSLRAVWESDTGVQIGLHFTDRGEVDYVLFSGASPQDSGRHYGTSSIEQIIAIVAALDLERLLRS